MTAPAGVGRPPALGRGAALITVATALSRFTGFVRVIVVAAAMGTTFLANTYQTANTAPNLVFELVAAGVLTSVFVPTFVEHIVGKRGQEGWDAANAMASIGLVVLIGIAGLVALCAVPIMRLLTLGVVDQELRATEVTLGARFLRLFAPQIVFYGAGMIMTAALHAHRRFVLPALAPIFNNVVVIAVYVAYAVSRGDRPPTVQGITSGETLLLGLGTTFGVVAMTVCLLPQVRGIGWRFSLRWQPRHPAVLRGARLGAWALGYAGGYQAGLIVVLALANRIEGGVAAYQWAFTFFFLPHALFAVPIFSVLFTAMAERAASDDHRGVAERLRQGLGMLVFVLVPIAAALFVLAGPVALVVFNHGVMTAADAGLVADVLAMFVLGLPSYSAFLILTRAFYALGETRTPALVNGAAVVVASLAGAVLFFALLETRWAVPGLALGHTLGFSVGAVLLGRRLGARLGPIADKKLSATAARVGIATLPSALVMWIVADAIPAGSATTRVASLALAMSLGAVVYVTASTYLSVPELRRLRALVSRSG